MSGSVESRIARLESASGRHRTLWTMSGVGLLILVSLAASSRSAQDPVGAGVVQCERLIVRSAGIDSRSIELWADQEGAHMVLGPEERDGVISLDTLDPGDASDPGAAISVRTGKSELVLSDGNISGASGSRAQWFLGPTEGTPSIVFFDETGSARARLRISQTGEGQLELLDSSGKTLRLTPAK